MIPEHAVAMNGSEQLTACCCKPDILWQDAVSLLIEPYGMSLLMATKHTCVLVEVLAAGCRRHGNATLRPPSVCCSPKRNVLLRREGPLSFANHFAHAQLVMGLGQLPAQMNIHVSVSQLFP